MRKFYRISEAAALIGVGASALRSYTNKGLIECSYNPAGQRVYSLEQINAYLGIETPRTVAFYVRASDGDNVKLNNQTKMLTERYGEPVKVYRDKASGLNENRKGLNSLLRDAKLGLFSTVCITQKDRLTRFGYKHLEQLLNEYSVQVEVLGEDSPEDLNQELMKDFMSLIASFSGRFYRLRGYKQQKQLLAQANRTIDEKQNH